MLLLCRRVPQARGDGRRQNRRYYGERDPQRNRHAIDKGPVPEAHRPGSCFAHTDLALGQVLAGNGFVARRTEQPAGDESAVMTALQREKLLPSIAGSLCCATTMSRGIIVKWPRGLSTQCFISGMIEFVATDKGLCGVPGTPPYESFPLPSAFALRSVGRRNARPGRRALPMSAEARSRSLPASPHTGSPRADGASIAMARAQSDH